MAKRASAKATRREVAARVQAEQRRREQRVKLIRNVLIGGAAVAVAATIGIVAIRGGQASTPNIAGVRTYTGLSRNHVTGTVQYPQTPPVGGDHNPVWLNCGIYTSPVPNENAVHDLEHGAVWITYRPDLAKSEVQTLTALVDGQSYVDLSPYPGLPAPVVATAWGKQLRLQSASDPRLKEFIDAYRQGPQNPEPGAPCTGGTGTPGS